MDFLPNPGKNLIRKVGSEQWLRYPIKTRFITEQDSLDEILAQHILPFLEKGDIVALGQKIISLLQKRIVYKKDIKVGRCARFLSKFAKKTPAGFSVGNPLKMQVAINLAGLPRILFAGLLGAISKVFGQEGNFYRLAGHQISQIDGFYDRAFSQYGQIGILGPVKCDELCQELKTKYGYSFLIVDINDLDGNILGRSSDLKGKEKLFLEILKDNPAGQLAQQTPILILRKQ